MSKPFETIDQTLNYKLIAYESEVVSGKFNLRLFGIDQSNESVFYENQLKTGDYIVVLQNEIELTRGKVGYKISDKGIIRNVLPYNLNDQVHQGGTYGSIDRIIHQEINISNSPEAEWYQFAYSPSDPNLSKYDKSNGYKIKIERDLIVYQETSERTSDLIYHAKVEYLSSEIITLQDRLQTAQSKLQLLKEGTDVNI